MIKSLKFLLIIPIAALISCSGNNVKISTKMNFEVVKLPDGSKACLNNKSSIKYSKEFKERIVYQTGEVFYNVKEGSSPFIVKTHVGEIKVLGTEFNVNTQNKELDVEVEEGAVELKIEEFIEKIRKGQKAKFKDTRDGIKIGDAEFKYKEWLLNLEKEFNKLGKEVEKSSKNINKESKKVVKDIKKAIKKAS